MKPLHILHRGLAETIGQLTLLLLALAFGLSTARSLYRLSCWPTFGFSTLELPNDFLPSRISNPSQFIGNISQSLPSRVRNCADISDYVASRDLRLARFVVDEVFHLAFHNLARVAHQPIFSVSPRQSGRDSGADWPLAGA
jgi:hypothetical protein